MLSHGNILSTIGLYHTVDPRHDTDNHLSFLPLGWIAEPILGIAAHVYSGLILNFPEEPETVRQNIREIAPEMLFYNARLWDSLVGMVQVRMNDASRLNRAALPPLSAGRLPHGRCQVQRPQPGPGLRRPTPWATGWSSARCATSWACRASAPPTPPARRSAPTRCASSTPWAST
jgi:long-chain acyl-CoA synthetase